LSLDLTEFVDYLMAGPEAGGLHARLKEASAFDLTNLSLRYLNAAGTNERRRDAVLALVRSEIERRGDDPELRDVRALVELANFNDAVQRGIDLDVEIALQSCEPFTESWL